MQIGNGRMGAMLYGGIKSEHIRFNAQSLWRGDNNWNGEYENGVRGFGPKYYLEQMPAGRIVVEVRMDGVSQFKGRLIGESGRRSIKNIFDLNHMEISLILKMYKKKS